MTIDSRNLHFKVLNDKIKEAAADVTINNCLGQRFIASGLSGKKITINGTPGNALGAYLNGAKIIVNGNAQDAVGDTMNCGEIIVNGSSGDATGYAMRGGEIYIQGDVGYRAGIHMKEYNQKVPVMIVGGKSGSFLGEYQAGGLICVLGLGCEDSEVISNFTGVGMHRGKIIIRADKIRAELPKQVSCRRSNDADMEELKPYLKKFSKLFKVPMEQILSKPFYTLSANSANPYKQLYVQN